MAPDQSICLTCSREGKLSLLKNESRVAWLWVCLVMGWFVTHERYSGMPQGAGDILFMLFCHTVNTWFLFSHGLGLVLFLCHFTSCAVDIRPGFFIHSQWRGVITLSALSSITTMWESRC